MPCFHPVPGWYAKRVNESGKRSIVFRLEDGFKDKPVAVPCGNCIGCRNARARMWSVRCLHESRMCENSWFLTLTYDDEHLPANGSLSVRDWQLFMKRFRKEYGPVRFFMCGQYGERSLRAHYHALFFGVDFEDRRRYISGDRGSLFQSERLSRCWQNGDVKFSALSEATIHYVTAYMGRSVLDREMCSRYGMEPEFQLMSRRPGLGADWLKRYWGDVYPEDAVTLRGGVKVRPPRFYDDYVEEVDPKLMRRLRFQRRRMRENDPDSTGSRLVVREVVAESKRRLFSGNDPEG